MSEGRTPDPDEARSIPNIAKMPEVLEIADELIAEIPPPEPPPPSPKKKPPKKPRT